MEIRLVLSDTAAGDSRESPATVSFTTPHLEHEMNAYENAERLAEILKAEKIADIQAQIEILKTCELGTEIRGFTVSTEVRRQRYIAHAGRNLACLQAMRATNVMKGTDYFLSDYE